MSLGTPFNKLGNTGGGGHRSGFQPFCQRTWHDVRARPVSELDMGLQLKRRPDYRQTEA